MRIARFSVDDEPKYGVVETDDPEGLVGTVSVLDSDPLYRPVELTGEKLQLADVRLLAPVIPRSKVVGIGRNYAAHAAELGNEVPGRAADLPQAEHLGDRPGRPHRLPDAEQRRPLRGRAGGGDRPDLPRRPGSEVARCIFGYTVANDVTARDLQKTDGQWARAKGFDTFCPLGPWIETELDVSDLRVTHGAQRRARSRTGGPP